MTPPAMTPGRFDVLLSGLVDGRLAEDELRELETTLTADEAAQRRFADFMLLHGMLAWGRAGDASDRDAKAIPVREVAPQGAMPGVPAARMRNRRWALAAAIVAAAVACVLGAVVLWAPWSGATEGEIARITKCVACRWAADSSVDEERLAVRPGHRLALSEGLAELTFGDGARLVLEGPAHIEVQSPREVVLRRGSVCVRASPQGRGFAVRVRGLRIVDRGTEFGVRVDDSQRGVEIRVFQGEVEAVRDSQKASHSTLTLRGGQAALYYADNDSLSSAPADTGQFVRDLSASRSIVDWRGDYTDARRLYSGGETVEARFGDDPQRMDRVHRRPFGETAPLCAEYDRTPAGRSGPFLGGYEIWRLGGGPLSGNDTGLQDGGVNDFQRLWYSNGRDRRVYGAWLFPKTGFLDLRGGPVAFGPASGLLVHVLRNEGGHYGVRFLVKSGGAYYLSQTASNQEGTFALGGSQLSNEMWARYHPDDDLRANGSHCGTSSTASNLTCGAGALRFDTPTSTLTDIEAVGLYAESVDSAGWPNRLLDWDRFSVHAERGN